MCNEPKRADYAKRDQKYTVLLDFPRIDLEKQFFPTLEKGRSSTDDFCLVLAVDSRMPFWLR